MNKLLTLTLGMIIGLAGIAHSAHSDEYNDYLKKIQGDMGDFGQQVDVFDQNPFQTGTALSNYYLSEKTLLLGRDAYFSMKANQLKTTNDVADYQFRTKVLRNHANNMLIQLVQSIKMRNEEGFSKVEAPKQQQDLENLIKACNQDAACVADRLKNPETSLANIFVDNFGLATLVFQQIPYMHVLEANSVYSLIQLMYIEVLFAQNNIGSVEYDLFVDKQKSALDLVRKNTSMSGWEKDFQTTMIKNLVNKWKKRIVERRFDHQSEFAEKAKALQAQNLTLLSQLDALQDKSRELYRVDWREIPCRVSFKTRGKTQVCIVADETKIDLKGLCDDTYHVWGLGTACVNDHRENQEDHDAVKASILSLRRGEMKYLGVQDPGLPNSFWEEL